MSLHEITSVEKDASSHKLVARNVSKVFGKGDKSVTALEGVDMTIEAGDFVCMIGPSGCGKTSLLNIIAGFEQVTSGTLTLDGAEIYGPGADRGVVFQQGALFPWMTVGQNVEFGPISIGKSKAEARTLSNEYLELVGLGAFKEHYPYQLSGGMQQRVGIARAFANKPDLLLMDEPFAALDQQNRELLQEEVKRIWRDTGQTIFLITHSIEEALFLGNKIMVMTARPGTIKASFRAEFSASSDVGVLSTAEFLEAKQLLFGMLREETLNAYQLEQNK